jgi:hypothetical protein
MKVAKLHIAMVAMALFLPQSSAIRLAQNAMNTKHKEHARSLLERLSSKEHANSKAVSER